MTEIFKRIMDRKQALELTWGDIAVKSHIRIASWMTGIPTSTPTDEELQKMAPVLQTTFEWLKYGDKKM